MRFNHKSERVRVRTWFAWLPVTATTYNIMEQPYLQTRWLETVTVRQEWHRGEGAIPGQWLNKDFCSPLPTAPKQ